MISAIVSESGQFFTEGSPKEVKRRIDLGEEITCWWYESHGQRNQEVFLFDPEGIKIVRTESEASPIEEM